MSGLAALLAGHTPPGVYRWHNVASVADVQHAVEHASWAFCLLDGWTIEDRESFLKATVAALQLSDSSGQGLDQLGEGLDSFDAGDRGAVLLWEGWSPLARKDAATFGQALELFRRRAGAGGGKLAVLLRGEGPELELVELPIKH